LRASADLFALEWKYPQVVRYGRSGQRQVVKMDEFYPLAQRYPGDHGNRRDISQPTKGGARCPLEEFRGDPANRNDEPHRQRGGMPTRGGQPIEDRLLAVGFIEVKGLWIELGANRLISSRVTLIRPGIAY
jgi:hypothetical protein